MRAVRGLDCGSVDQGGTQKSKVSAIVMTRLEVKYRIESLGTLEN